MVVFIKRDEELQGTMYRVPTCAGGKCGPGIPYFRQDDGRWFTTFYKKDEITGDGSLHAYHETHKASLLERIYQEHLKTKPMEQKSQSLPLATDRMTANGEAPQRELTLGEKIIGLDFNPSGDPEITRVKREAANNIDMMHKTHLEKLENQARNLIFEEACGAILAAQMATVKYMTFRHG